MWFGAVEQHKPPKTNPKPTQTQQSMQAESPQAHMGQELRRDTLSAWRLAIVCIAMGIS